MKTVEQYLYDLERFGLTPTKILTRLISDSSRNPRIVTVTMPKSGTNLLQRILILHPSLRRAWLPTLGNRNKEIWSDVQKLLKPVRQGSIISTHFDYDEDLALVLQRELGFKTIFMVRDPRDVVISAIHYIQSWPGHPHKKLISSMGSDKEKILAIINGHSIIPSISQKIRRFSGWIDKSHLVRFEDAVGTAGGGDDFTQRESVRNIYKYLDMPLNDKLLNYICGNARSQKTQTFRRGLINEWKNQFDSELTSAFKIQAGQLLIDMGYEKNLEWAPFHK